MSELRRYVVHPASSSRAASLSVEAASFEQAALDFADAWHDDLGDEGAVQVIVLECESGRECCLTVDLGTDEARPCD